ncbi:MAG: 6-hydroxymethyl-7,8-dihydropterin pyrophosphokinase [Thermoprotei archaeon]|nr:MAG: 6-hydroxymethyl-7,8-dihydropterin pyrophosphokinase [Thermoprotei archaeon]
MPLYAEIARELKLSPVEDRRATQALSSLLEGRACSLQALESLLHGRRALVLGAGPSLESFLEAVDLKELRERFLLIAADGATSALMERGVAPHVVCTDLDGRVEDQAEANAEGSLLVVHAHGDNVQALERYVPYFKGPLIGSTQVEPALYVHNFGGFTDGDRCAFLALWGGAVEVVLAGMDLGVKVGRYSKPWLSGEVEASPRKAAKLRIARRLLEWLAERSGARLWSVSGAWLRGIEEVGLEGLS